LQKSTQEAKQIVPRGYVYWPSIPTGICRGISQTYRITRDTFNNTAVIL